MSEERDPVMERIGDIVGLGDRGEARQRFAELWETIGPDGDALHRCALAHYAADVQDDPVDELRWDELALAAADELTDERVRDRSGALDVAGFYPSLHLNLADVHRRLGDRDRAEQHLERAKQRVGALADDGYGQMIRAGIERCAARLEGGENG